MCSPSFTKQIKSALEGLDYFQNKIKIQNCAISFSNFNNSLTGIGEFCLHNAPSQEVNITTFSPNSTVTELLEGKHNYSKCIPVTEQAAQLLCSPDPSDLSPALAESALWPHLVQGNALWISGIRLMDTVTTTRLAHTADDQKKNESEKREIQDQKQGEKNIPPRFRFIDLFAGIGEYHPPSNNE